MKVAVVILAAAIALPSWWRETNSHASSARGSTAFEKKQYVEAAKAFGRAEELAPSARNVFNLGTSEIAAGNREQGSAHLAESMKDPSVRADALFNRGNSALESKSFDHAIRDYSDALRANPDHAAAKRNLEIALARQKQQRSSAGGNRQQQQPNPQKPQQQPAPSRNPAQKGQPDLDALLRSVQQQEQEELRRMKRQPAEGRVGW
jgi:Ca-activated chloride channel family protein